MLTTVELLFHGIMTGARFVFTLSKEMWEPMEVT